MKQQTATDDYELLHVLEGLAFEETDIPLWTNEFKG